jgi:hypothetical protein
MPLARAMLALGRARGTGVLRLASPRGVAAIAVRAGRPCAATGVGLRADTLGDVLARRREVDLRAHAEAATASPPVGPVGRWLADAGLARPEAVSAALREQLRGRVQALFRWDAVEVRFAPGEPDVGVPLLDEPPTAGELVVSALRASLRDVAAHELRRGLGDGLLVLTPLGEALLADLEAPGGACVGGGGQGSAGSARGGGAALWPDEGAMIGVLRAGAAVDVLLATARGSPRALRLLAGFKLLGAAAAPAGAGSYATLLRKTRELRRAACAETLLELEGKAAPEQARRSLRRLAGALHPDRLGPHAPEALRRASAEVLGALAQAEERLRARAARSA